MKRISFIKGLVLFSSLSLVTLFLLYRVGYFDNKETEGKINTQTSPNGGNVNSNKIDTSIKIKDRTKPVIFPSSKTIILTDKNPFIKDSLKKSTVTSKYPKTETDILSSSKSGIIFKSKKRNMLKQDTVKLDILKKPKK